MFTVKWTDTADVLVHWSVQDDHSNLIRQCLCSSLVSFIYLRSWQHFVRANERKFNYTLAKWVLNALKSFVKPFQLRRLLSQQFVSNEKVVLQRGWKKKKIQMHQLKTSRANLSTFYFPFVINFLLPFTMSVHCQTNR